LGKKNLAKAKGTHFIVIGWGGLSMVIPKTSKHDNISSGNIERGERKKKNKYHINRFRRRKQNEQKLKKRDNKKTQHGGGEQEGVVHGC